VSGLGATPLLDKAPLGWWPLGKKMHRRIAIREVMLGVHNRKRDRSGNHTTPPFGTLLENNIIITPVFKRLCGQASDRMG
jgi:hypothetical protein